MTDLNQLRLHHSIMDRHDRSLTATGHVNLGPAGCSRDTGDVSRLTSLRTNYCRNDDECPYNPLPHEVALGGVEFGARPRYRGAGSASAASMASAA
jgi:hypothetical protein